MHKFLPISLALLAIVTTVRSIPQQQPSGSLTDLISSVFGDNTGDSQPPPPVTADPISGRNPELPKVTGCPQGEECVKHFLCKSGKLNKDGTGVIDIRFDDDTPKPCPHYLEVCCSTGSTVETPVLHPDPTPEGCGYRNIDGVGFKITGDRDNETQFGEFPWMVAILKEEKAGDQTLNLYQCGGSLIHPSVVLTAAHCVFGKPADSLKIRAGEWDTQTKNELIPHQDRNVVDFVTHDHYNKGSLFNDVALLFLNEPVEIADNVKTVCLPPADYNFDYSRCYASGWGKDVFGQMGKYQVILKKIDLPIVPHDICQSSLRTSRLGKHFELHRSFICAGGEKGKDTCKGDGGSPLVCPIEGKKEQYYQAGMVAWGIGCGDEYPGVYVNLPELRGWLDEQLEYKRIDKKFYTP